MFQQLQNRFDHHPSSWELRFGHCLCEVLAEDMLPQVALELGLVGAVGASKAGGLPALELLVGPQGVLVLVRACAVHTSKQLRPVRLWGHHESRPICNVIVNRNIYIVIIKYIGN